MSDQMTKALQALADKLGVTVQYLWAVLIRGNRVEGVICALFCLLGIVAIYAGYKLILKGIADNEEGYTFGGIILSIAGIALFLGPLYWAIMDTFCPEYGALADILSHLKL